MGRACSTYGVTRNAYRVLVGKPAEKRPLGRFKRFREGKEMTEDEPCSGRPSTSRTPEIIEKVRRMLAEDRRLTLRLIAEELVIVKDTAHTIVRDDLGRNICPDFCRTSWRAENKTDGNFWRPHVHVWLGSIASGKHRHGRWDLVLPVRSGIKTAIDGVVFTDFPAIKKSSSKIQSQNTVERLLPQ